MNQKDLQMLLLLGGAALAIYFIFIRKSTVPVGGPAALPSSATYSGGAWIPGPGGFPETSATPSQQSAYEALITP